MAVDTYKALLRCARAHAREAANKYGGERDSDLFFKAHIQASYIALQADHVQYVEYCKKAGIATKDEEWAKLYT